MQKFVTILGINGRIGQEAARAFVAAGWQVTGLVHASRPDIVGVRFVTGDAFRPDDVRTATAGSDVVVNAVNLAYDKWGNGRYEALTAAIVEGLKGSGKTMLFVGNIYNFAADQHVLSPETPYRPEKDKGRIRVRIEAMYEQAARRGDFRLLVLRAPDFFGPGATGTMFDLITLSRLKSGVLTYPGPLDLGHSWAYLPDLGRAYVKLAEASDTFGPIERFHFAGHFATGSKMMHIAQAAIPKKTRIVRLSWAFLGAVGLFVPVVREVVKMRYLWFTPHRLVDSRLDAILGPDFATSFDEAVKRTVRSYLPEAEAGAALKAATA
jgi:nucleoside-diphosphate-sugar epimerase